MKEIADACGKLLTNTQAEATAGHKAIAKLHEAERNRRWKVEDETRSHQRQMEASQRNMTFMDTLMKNVPNMQAAGVNVGALLASMGGIGYTAAPAQLLHGTQGPTVEEEDVPAGQGMIKDEKSDAKGGL